MRYTLRLLTAQQFTRAASLICSMELIRKKCKPIKRQGILWCLVGSANTPNDRNAVTSLNELRKNQKKEKDYPFY